MELKKVGGGGEELIVLAAISCACAEDCMLSFTCCVELSNLTNISDEHNTPAYFTCTVYMCVCIQCTRWPAYYIMSHVRVFLTVTNMYT